MLGGIFFVSLLFTFSSSFPSGNLRFSHSGRPVHNDATVIWRLFKLKKLPEEYQKALEYFTQKNYKDASILLDRLCWIEMKRPSFIMMKRLPCLRNLPIHIAIEDWRE